MLDPILQFFSEGIGKGIADLFRFLYEVFFPRQRGSRREG